MVSFIGVEEGPPLRGEPVALPSVVQNVNVQLHCQSGLAAAPPTGMACISKRASSSAMEKAWWPARELSGVFMRNSFLEWICDWVAREAWASRVARSVEERGSRGFLQIDCKRVEMPALQREEGRA
jgi:hypothetical protein